MYEFDFFLNYFFVCVVLYVINLLNVEGIFNVFLKCIIIGYLI